MSLVKPERQYSLDLHLPCATKNYFSKVLDYYLNAKTTAGRTYSLIDDILDR
ncbi:hypothetical protein PMIT1320_00566 [Prochlorococcus marinus str. MIT 1320]|nr:hypothetical protein PMIT1320_00566 [Prochlorococcus marinus str. MIT 1320]